jgi:hypothetical protein
LYPRGFDTSHAPHDAGAKGLPAEVLSAAAGQHDVSRVPKAAPGSPASKVLLLTLSSAAAVD